MKYKLTDEKIEFCGHTLRRIVCVTAFASVHAGELGGWVESEENLSQFGDAWVYGDAKVCENAKVCGDAKVYGYANVCGDAEVKQLEDYIVLKNDWSSGRFYTYTASNKMWKVGCFYGTGEELIAKAYKDSELSGKCYEASVRYVEELERIKAELSTTKE